MVAYLAYHDPCRIRRVELETDIKKALNPFAKRTEIPRKYAELVAMHLPRPIHDEVAYENTVEFINALAGHKLNADQEDYLELLSRLVETYEDVQVSELSDGTPLDRLKYLLTENDLGGEGLADLLEVDRSTAYKLLKGSRNLTAEHIRILTQRFKVSSDCFLA